MITVKATREGLVGQKTSTGFKIDSGTPFVALPSAEALRLWVWVRNGVTGKSCRALVLDVGPWNEHDNAYVFQRATMESGYDPNNPTVRPLAEDPQHRDQFGRITNGAGIDLGEAVWKELGMTDNGLVDWAFVLP